MAKSCSARVIIAAERQAVTSPRRGELREVTPPPIAKAGGEAISIPLGTGQCAYLGNVRTWDWQIASPPARNDRGACVSDVRPIAPAQRPNNARRRARLSAGQYRSRSKYASTAGVPGGNTTHGCFDIVNI